MTAPHDTRWTIAFCKHLKEPMVNPGMTCADCEVVEVAPVQSEGERRTTVLDGYYATGDHECFVFDKHADPYEHGDSPDEECRVYPNDLLPDGVARHYGRWEISVSFVPLSPPTTQEARTDG